MNRIRQLNRPRLRCITRYSTRMLGGLRRPRPVDELLVVCDALERMLEIDLRLRPYMQEQIQLQKQRLFDQQIDEALDRVYGPEKKAQV